MPLTKLRIRIPKKIQEKIPTRFLPTGRPAAFVRSLVRSKHLSFCASGGLKSEKEEKKELLMSRGPFSLSPLGFPLIPAPPSIHSRPVLVHLRRKRCRQTAPHQIDRPHALLTAVSHARSSIPPQTSVRVDGQDIDRPAPSPHPPIPRTTNLLPTLLYSTISFKFATIVKINALLGALRMHVMPQPRYSPRRPCTR